MCDFHVVFRLMSVMLNIFLYMKIMYVTEQNKLQYGPLVDARSGSEKVEPSGSIQLHMPKRIPFWIAIKGLLCRINLGV